MNVENYSVTITQTALFRPTLYLLVIIMSILGAIIGMQIIVTLGVSANTSVIGAVIALLLSRINIGLFNSLKAVEAQNLVQTAISASTFAAANSMMIAIGVPWLLDMKGIIMPMLAGAFLAVIVDGSMLYGLFNTKAYPATHPWPSGVATAETLWAGNRGGKRLLALISGLVVGVLGAAFAVPLASAGIALIASMLAMFMFAIGLLLRGFSESALLPWQIYENYIPHGFLLGAGIVALGQITMMISRKGKQQQTALQQNPEIEQSRGKLQKTLLKGSFFYFIIALLLTVVTQIFSEMSFLQLTGFLLFATAAAIIQEMIVGTAAMHSGWFPATAAALISLMIGVLLGFPPAALAVLVGFCVATGPAFADMGADLKTGFMIRGFGKNVSLEQYGRRQQYFASMTGFSCAVIVVALSYPFYFEQDKVVPASRLYAATIQAGSTPDVAIKLAIWAIPGALLQLIGTARHQLGILFGTGLMINYPIAGWTVLATLVFRIIIQRVFKINQEKMSTFAGGLIAGDALYSAALVMFPAIKAKLLAIFFR